MPLSIGIIGFQGDVSEHAELLKKAANKLGAEVEVKEVRNLAQLSSVEAIIIPGGESTTMFKLLKLYSLYERIREMAMHGLPVMGTCAGLILISSKTNDDRVEGMGLIDTEVERNAYGRQIDSFMEDIEIKGIGKYRAVFIRAPIISVPGNTEILAEQAGKPVMVRKGKVLGLTFHPELTKDTRVHEYFIRMIEGEGFTSSGNM